MEKKLYLIIGHNAITNTSWYEGENGTFKVLSDGCTWDNLQAAEERCEELNKDDGNKERQNTYKIEEF